MRSDGIFQIYTGSGKGKTTAAFGLALRALGAGKQVAVVQFMKQENASAETVMLQKFPLARVYAFGREGFVDIKNPLKEDYRLAECAMERALTLQTAVDLLILDEINNALYFQLLALDKVISFVRAKPATLDLVFTGRNVPEELVALADLVTEMREIKHPWRQGIPARKGIDF